MKAAHTRVRPRVWCRDLDVNGALVAGLVSRSFQDTDDTATFFFFLFLFKIVVIAFLKVTILRQTVLNEATENSARGAVRAVVCQTEKCARRRYPAIRKDISRRNSNPDLPKNCPSAPLENSLN